MGEPTVSIVIPAYNHQPFVGEAIESVLTQTFPDLELIVIDDGSTDGTLQVINGYHDPRLTVISQENRGLSATLNRGLAMARGRFFGFLPSDDLFLPDKLQVQLAFMREHPALDALFSFQKVIDAHGKEISHDPIVAWTQVPWRTRDEILPALLERNFLVAPSALLRMDALRGVGGFDEGLRYAQDYDMWLRVLKRSDAALLPLPLVAYRWHGGNLTYAPTEANIYERAIILLKAYKNLDLEEIFPALRGQADPGARARAHVTLAQHLTRSGLIELLPVAQIHVDEARRLDPGSVVDPHLVTILQRRPAFMDLRDRRLETVASREAQVLGREHQALELEQQALQVLEREAAVDHREASLQALEPVLQAQMASLRDWERKILAAQARLERVKALWFVRPAVWVYRRTRDRGVLVAKVKPLLTAPLRRVQTALFRRAGAASPTLPAQGTPAAAESLPDWRLRAVPKVSVVLPVYNQAELVEESIASVLAQSYPSIELIVIDDGSTDDVQRLLARYVDHPRMKIFSKPNQGIARALTAGFTQADGEFLTWTSADNVSRPDQIERLADFLLRHPDVSMVYSNVEVIDQHGDLLAHSTYRRHNQAPRASSLLTLPREVETLGEIDDNFINASFLYRSEIAKTLGPYDWALLGTEDYDYWLRAALHFTIRHLDSEAPLYRYRIHANTLSERDGPSKIYANVSRLIAYHRERTAYWREGFDVLLVADRGPTWSQPGRYERLAEAFLGLGSSVVWLYLLPAPDRGGERPGVLSVPISPELAATTAAEYPGRFRKRLVLWASRQLSPAGWKTIGGREGAYCVLDVPPQPDGGGHAVDAVTHHAMALRAPAPGSPGSVCPAGTGVEPIPLLKKARDNRYPVGELPPGDPAVFLCYLPPGDHPLDFELLAEASRLRPHYWFAFVPRRGEIKGLALKIRAIPRTLFLQPRAPRDLYSVLSACRGLFLPLRTAPPDPEPLVAELLAISLSAARPAVTPHGLPVPPDAPGYYRYRGLDEFLEALDRVIATPVAPEVCDRYLDRISWRSVAGLMLAKANNDLFFRKTRSSKLDDAPLVPLRAMLAPDRRTILVETRTLDKGGLEEIVYGLLMHLDHRRYRTVVACVDGDGDVAERCRRGGITVHCLGPDKDAAYEALLERYAVDVVNTHYSHFGTPIAARRGIPVVEVIHNLYVWLAPPDIRRFGERDGCITTYVAVSPMVADYARDVLGVPADKLLYIPNGVDVARHRRLKMRTPRITREQLELRREDYVFLHVAAVDGRKGHNALIAALARLLPAHGHATVISVGPVMDEQYYHAMAERVRRAGLQDRFRFLGFVADVADLYRLADAFVLPSLIEGMSVSLLEAMLYGLPIIATRVGGAPAILEGEPFARLIRPAYDDIRGLDLAAVTKYALQEIPRNVAELEAAMRDFIARPDHWRALGARGIETIEKQYDMAAMAARYGEVFDQVCSGGAWRGPSGG